MDTQSFIIESYNDIWKTIVSNVIGSLDDLNFSRCFMINTEAPLADYQGNYPWSEIRNGCEYGGSLDIAKDADDYYEEKMFNSKSYKKVYYEAKGDMNNGYEIYWNLKYGIISFVGISNGTKLTWIFEDKLL